MSRSRALGLLLGFAADRMFGDPVQFHPVAGLGQFASFTQRRTYADDRIHGLVHTAALVGSTGALGIACERLSSRRPFTHALLTATATWTVLGGRSLTLEADVVRSRLEAADLAAARQRLGRLVGRDTADLDVTEISRATIESVAENTSDAVVAPLVAGAFGGIGGLLTYRAANTLDAMIGYRNPRYERFGWAAARLDDLLNLPGSRLTAALATVFAPTVGGRSAEACATMRRDARRHPSPNAGLVEAAFAGALHVRLGGVNRYGDRLEDRHSLGTGASPSAGDIGRATRLANYVDLAAVVVAAAIALTASRWPRRHR